MLSLKDLRRRIRSINNTKLITRAMRSVAASKMRKTQDRRTKAKPYVERLQKLVAKIVHSVGSEGQPLLEKRSSPRKLVVVLTSDRGLCGAFNVTVNRFAENDFNQQRDDTAIYAIGKKARDFFLKRGYQVVKAELDFRGNIDTPRILEIGRDLERRFLQGEFDQIDLIYNRAISAMSYKPVREPFLPLDANELVANLPKGAEHDLDVGDYIIEPDPNTLLATLLPKYVETKMLFTFVDAFAAEHQARMIAMTNANNNCEELIDSLTLQMNKARQAAITKEILEITGGAEALR